MNKKRKVNVRFENLGTYRLTRKDILAFEDIIRKHMITFNKIRQDHYIKSGNDIERVRNADYYDTYTEVSPYWLGGRGVEFDDGIRINIGPQYIDTFDSIKEVPIHMPVRYMKISGKPGIFLTFSPLKTILTTRRAEAGILERSSMDLAARRIKSRIQKCDRFYINTVR